jgi:hypoxanthine phosphoribosyltransferase
VNKRYISPGDLLRDAYRLGWQVFESGYRPDLLLGVWRGGAPVAIAMHELLHILGVRSDHFAVRTVSYTGISQRDQEVRVDGLECLASRTAADQRLLVVDDVHDTGLSLQQLVRELKKLYHPHTPEIRLATPWYKPGNNRTGRIPDYRLHDSDDWLVFPHELDGLTAAEIADHKPELSELMGELKPHLESPQA